MINTPYPVRTIFGKPAGSIAALLLLSCTLLIILKPAPALGQETPRSLAETDRRFTEIRHLDLKYKPGPVPTRAEWEARTVELRQQILASSGLLPMPVKGPLKTQVVDRIDRGSYTIEKVYVESLPGFYLTGNLYRPKVSNGPNGQTKKLPAVLCPHGHWTYGRLENSNLNSTAGRAANFALQGYVAFTYDMVGYNDSAAISHRFAPGHREGADRESLWSVNILGLQLWNSIRAVDLLLSLPEVDAERISITGESGGGTQTFLLTAVDERVNVSGPVNMISYVMQGGSLCENAPNLRIDTTNVEIGALAAPRPMIMVSATGDWTRNTWIEEYPAIRAIYQLFGAEDRLTTTQINAPHNYNQESREAVYRWFAKWMIDRPDFATISERQYEVVPATDQLVFYGRSRPAGELDEPGLIRSLVERHQAQLNQALAAGLEQYRATFGPTLRQSILATYPENGKAIDEKELPAVAAGFNSTVGKTRGVSLSRQKVGDVVRVYQTSPTRLAANSPVTIVVDPLPAPQQIDAETANLRDGLVKAGHSVVVVKVFPGGRVVPAEYKFFTTYNRTDAALRIQDILTATAWTKSKFPGSPVKLVGVGRAGLWALLARGLAPSIDQVAVDAAGFNNGTDDDFVAHLPIPGLRRAGDFTTAVSLAPPTPLFIYQTGEKFQTTQLQEIFKSAGRSSNLVVEKQKADQARMIGWLTSTTK